MIRRSWTGLLALFLAVTSHADPGCLRYEDYAHWVGGTIGETGAASAIAVDLPYAYVADSGNGLQVFDVSDPSIPVLLAQIDALPEEEHLRDLEKQGDYLFATADYDHALVVFDVSDPLDPVLVAAMPGYGHRLDVEGSRAYVVHPSRLYIFDVSAPTAPIALAYLDLAPYLEGVAAVGDYLYVPTSTASEFLVIDVSDPTQPELLAEVETPEWCTDLQVVGTHAFIGGWDYFAAFSLADPAAPVLVSSLDTRPIGRFEIHDGIAFCTSAGRMDFIDLSDPHALASLGKVYVPGINDVAIAGGHAFVSAGGEGLQILDVSPPAIAPLVGSAATSGTAQDVAVQGPHAFLAAYDAGIAVVDVSDPALPVPGAVLGTPGFAWAVEAFGDHLYIADGPAGLQIASIGDPGAPFLVGGKDTPGQALGVAVDGSLAYLADGNAGLVVLDVSDPANPTILGSVNTPGTARRLAVHGDRVFVADGVGGLQIVDVSVPLAPAVVGSVPGRANGVFVGAPYVYVVGRSGNRSSLRVYPLGEPTTLLAEVALPTGAEDVEVEAGVAYVASGGSGILAVDVSWPEAPTFLGSAMTANLASAIRVSNGYVFVSIRESGLQIGSQQCAVVAAIPAIADGWDGLVVRPNPVERSAEVRFEAKPGAPTRLDLFDATGRRVAPVWVGEGRAAAQDLTWNPVRADGSMLPAGVYYLRLTSGSETLRRTVIVR